MSEQITLSQSQLDQIIRDAIEAAVSSNGSGTQASNGTRSRCAGTTKTGSSCSRFVKNAGDYCQSHQPTNGTVQVMKVTMITAIKKAVDGLGIGEQIYPAGLGVSKIRKRLGLKANQLNAKSARDGQKFTYAGKGYKFVNGFWHDAVTDSDPHRHITRLS